MRVHLRGGRRRLEKPCKAETRSWGGDKNQDADTNTDQGRHLHQPPVSKYTCTHVRMKLNMHVYSHKCKCSCTGGGRKRGGEEKEQEERNKEQWRVCFIA